MIPEAFLARMRAMPGLDLPAFLDALRAPPVRAFRLNPLKTDEKTLLPLLPFHTEPLPFADGAFLAKAEAVGSLPAHHAGMLYMQDPSAISAVAAALPPPGARVIDLCVAPGGKTAQLAAAIGERGVLVSNEYVPARCRILQGNVERMGLCNTVVTCLDTAALAELYGAYFDLVVADAPCSGEGMFRKYEAAGAEWSLKNVLACAARQAQILDNAARLTRPGGRLLYSTCTFSIEENEANVDAFLTRHPAFHLVPVAPAVAAVTADGVPFSGSHAGEALALCRRFYPHLSPGEGQFIALLEREEDGTAATARDSAVPLSSAEGRAVGAQLNALVDLPADLRAVLLREEFCLAPDIPLPPRGVFAAGVTVGRLQKGRLLPHHHLFSAFGRRFLRRLPLADGDPRVGAYLAGEEIACPELEGVPSGFAAILYENAPLGGGKAVLGCLKNHYPKGLRQRTAPTHIK